MIITNIIGGLGNQMFQYAAGLALSAESDQKLELATDMFDTYGLHHGFELARVFDVKAPVTTQENMRKLVGWRAHPIVRKILGRTPALSICLNNSFLTEHSCKTEDEFFSRRQDAYLHGYWQSDRYFDRHSRRLRQAFTFRTPLNAQNADLMALIATSTSVSVHIRRGDYLSPKNATIYSQCTIEYFILNMKFLVDRLGPINFYIFSDDTRWVENLFRGTDFNYTIISHNKGPESFNDMRLMSACDHHIIANSSFSWWGAWLNSKPGKIVIAPTEWMTGVSSSGIVPSTWLRQ